MGASVRPGAATRSNRGRYVWRINVVQDATSAFLSSFAQYAAYLTYVTTGSTLVGTKEVTVSAVHYDSYSDARAHLKDILDAAARGQIATVRREGSTAVVVDVERLRRTLLARVPSRAQVVHEAGGWSVFVPGLPVAADGATLDEAMTEMIDALREYADDWQDRLQDAPNHRDNWAVVQLVGLCDDGQLHGWLVGLEA